MASTYTVNTKVEEACATIPSPEIDLGINVTLLDITGIGKMYDVLDEPAKNPDGSIPRLAGVRIGSVLHKILKLMSEQINFQDVFHKIEWDKLPVKKKSDGGRFVYGLSVECIHYGLACMHSVFSKKTKMDVLGEFDDFDHHAMRRFLSHILFGKDDVDIIMAHYEKNPETVKAIFSCIVKRSSIDALSRPGNESDGEDEEDEGSEKPLHSESDNTESVDREPVLNRRNENESTELVDEEDETKEEIDSGKTNIEIAKELIEFIKNEENDDHKIKILDDLITTTAKTLEENKCDLRNCDQHEQAILFNANLGTTMLISFSLFGPSHPFFKKLMNVMLLK